MKIIRFSQLVKMLCIIFEKLKFYLFHWNLIFQCPNSICIHNKISCACHIPSISNLFRKIEQRLLFKMVPNMNGFVYRLVKTWDHAMYFSNAPRINQSNTFRQGGKAPVYKHIYFLHMQQDFRLTDQVDKGMLSYMGGVRQLVQSLFSCLR